MTKPEDKKSHPTQPKGSEMCSIGPDGRATNGEIMLEMLGDEPDVSHTSLDLAKKLGKSTQTLKMLDATHADLEESRQTCTIAGPWPEIMMSTLEFFFWEPQHLDRSKRATPPLGLKKVMERLRHLEVTLNHSLTLFFVLAPASLRNLLFETVFKRPFEGEFEMYGSGIEATLGLPNGTQPDFMFASRDDVVFVEMKVGAKSSVEQVLKYALLGLAKEVHSGRPKFHHLALLAPSAFESLWPERFADSADLHRVLAETHHEAFLARHGKHLAEHESRFQEIVENFDISSFTYSDLTEFLNNQAPNGQSGAETVYRNLIDGMVGELRRRSLTNTVLG
jgi:hypothetical protein